MLVELSAKIEIAHNRGVEDTDALENASEVVSQLNQTKSKAGKGSVYIHVAVKMGLLRPLHTTTENAKIFLKIVAHMYSC